MRILTFNSYKPIVGAVLTLLLVLAYPLLPARTYSIIPGISDNNHLYDDRGAGGNSRATWLNEETRASWFCDVQPGILYPFCGFNVVFNQDATQGIDLSTYDEIHLKLSYQGPDDRVRLYLRNFNPIYSEKGVVDSSKFNAVELSLAELENDVVINLREFTVADWWVKQHNVLRKHALAEFTNIIAVGFDRIDGYQFGEHTFHLHAFSFHGRWISEEHWYLSIMLLWVLISLVSAFHKLTHLDKKTQEDQLLIGTMSEMNLQLAEETNKYKSLSTIDPLTGTFNRLGFDIVVKSLVTSKHRAVNSLVMIDADLFKNINDEHGHNVGDQVLVRIAAVIMDNTRSIDSVCRWGGEEFILLCPSSNELQAFGIAEKIRQLIRKEEFIGIEGLQITASFGVTLFDHAEGLSEALTRADAALYEAKNTGRDKTVRFSSLK